MAKNVKKEKKTEKVSEKATKAEKVEKIEKVEVEVEDEVEEIKPKKEKKTSKEPTQFSRILNVFLWIVLLAWMAICLVDFFRVRNEKKPVFCISKDTIKYDDGDVNVCLGLGYKVFDYNRDSFEAIEFGPFWSSDRSEEKAK